MAIDEPIDERTMSVQLRGMPERERNRELELAAALGSPALSGAKTL